MRIKQRVGIRACNWKVREGELLCVLLGLCGAIQPLRAEDSVSTPGAGRGLVTDDHITAILTPRWQAVLSAEVSGQIVAINKELGERFEPGDVLMKLDDLTYRVNKETAEAKAQAAESNLAQVQKLAADRTRQRHTRATLEAAEANLLATQNLYNDGHSSQVDLENAKRDATVAKTECELADSVSAKELTNAKRELVITRGQRDIAGDELDACTIRAPFGGRVARLLVHEHEFVERGTPLMETVDDHVLLAKFLLPSALFRSVHKGQELNLFVIEASETVVAKVSHISAVLDPASVTFEVHAEVDNTERNLWAGMNGSLSLSEIKGQ
ncbi:MAG: HlyD family efflux transporter periplasmic adaptor subunit [Planctomycetes bacterium]|nr:HlyD family efflux transporter periplasmic adaptor subunit [Planctomycetota bacterium]